MSDAVLPVSSGAITPDSPLGRLMRGAIDVHVHAGPDPFHDRPLDALGLARHAREAGMRAVVLKCHSYGTGPLARMVNQVVPDFRLVGSLVLNVGVGGLNPEVVEIAARTGAKVIWMPTYSSTVDAAMRKKGGGHYPIRVSQYTPAEGISLLDRAGRLVSQVAPILDIIQSYHLVLGTGHISAPEIFAITEAARQREIKVTITHPLNEISGNPLTIAQQRELVGKGAYIEHTFIDCMPWIQGMPPETIVENVRAVGVEHCVLSTDFGQTINPLPPEGFRIMLANMLRLGLSEQELEVLVKVNPARLLDLD
ncbi:MAG: DUF6282 family protein [Chloroflexota bacterium]